MHSLIKQFRAYREARDDKGARMHLAKVGGRTLPCSEHTHLALPPTLINWFTVDVIKSRRVNQCLTTLSVRTYDDSEYNQPYSTKNEGKYIYKTKLQTQKKYWLLLSQLDAR